MLRKLQHHIVNQAWCYWRYVSSSAVNQWCYWCYVSSSIILWTRFDATDATASYCELGCTLYLTYIRVALDWSSGRSSVNEVCVASKLRISELSSIYCLFGWYSMEIAVSNATAEGTFSSPLWVRCEQNLGGWGKYENYPLHWQLHYHFQLIFSLITIHLTFHKL